MISVKELLDTYFLNKQQKGKKRKKTVPPPYPHDIQLETVLPEMFETYQKLDLFTENLLLPINGGTDRWPSLFFGATGTRTNLHVDLFGASSTMAVFRGRKQFLLFAPQDGPNLCMDTPNKGLHYGVGEDPFRPDFDRCPSAKDATAFIADVRAGDIVFIPGSYHHAARNLEHSLGISQNFLTAFDYRSIMESLGGYGSKLRREKQQRDTPIGMDFLATRDMYLLLSETEYVYWHTAKQWWNANDATNEAYEIIMRHMEKVLESAPDPKKVSTRLAYFSNIRTMVAALKAFGAWGCLEMYNARDIIQEPAGASTDKGAMAHSVAIKMEIRLEKAFALNQKPSCQSIYNAFLKEVRTVSIPNAVQTLGNERGLTKHCC